MDQDDWRPLAREPEGHAMAVQGGLLQFEVDPSHRDHIPRLYSPGNFARRRAAGPASPLDPAPRRLAFFACPGGVPPWPGGAPPEPGPVGVVVEVEGVVVVLVDGVVVLVDGVVVDEGGVVELVLGVVVDGLVVEGLVVGVVL